MARKTIKILEQKLEDYARDYRECASDLTSYIKKYKNIFRSKCLQNKTIVNLKEQSDKDARIIKKLKEEEALNKKCIINLTEKHHKLTADFNKAQARVKAKEQECQAVEKRHKKLQEDFKITKAFVKMLVNNEKEYTEVSLNYKMEPSLDFSWNSPNDIVIELSDEKKMNTVMEGVNDA